MVELSYINNDFLLALGIITAFSLFQGIFGVGLLVFGTPTFLLLGYSFNQALSLLLPCSVIISFLQTTTEINIAKIYIKKMLIFVLLPLVLGLYLSLNRFNILHLRVVLGLILIFSAYIRTSQSIQMRLTKIILKVEPLYLLVLGFIHGLSNMGGGLLTVYASSIGESKHKIRTIISSIYLFMAISQILTLIVLRQFLFEFRTLLFMIIAGITYTFSHKYIFKHVSEQKYGLFLTLFMICYSMVLIFV